MEPPAFPTSGLQTVRAAPGSEARLVLPLPSGTPPFHFEWSRAGASLDDRFTTSDDAGGVRLTVSAARTGDTGVYTLQARNAGGSDTTRVRLEVAADEAPTGDDPPNFLRRLQDLTVKVGTRMRFLVEIVSSTECKVTWYRNERRLLEAERVSLARDGNFWCAELAAVSVDDAGRWTCTAENLGGRASCSAHLNVLVPKAYKRPVFVEELRALLTEQGTVSLECKVVGVPTPELRWFKDSREIKAGDVFALTANAEDPTSLGTYTCEAVNCMGRAYSSSKVHVVGRASREGSAKPSTSGVTPEPPPIFTKELEDQYVRICERLALGCHIVVPPWPRSVVWYNKEGKVEPSERYHVLEDGVGGYMLEVPSAEWPDEGEWKCVATSSGGRVGISTCYVTMDVPKNYRKPRFMENLQAVLTEEGLVSFECKVVGFPTPVLSWFKDGQELKPGDVYQLTGTNSLGSYCCIARNCMGQASSSAELTVEDIQNQLNEEEKLQLFTENQAPKFVQGLKSIEAKIDEPFRFTIKVTIPPEPSVLWYRDDQPMDESTRCHLGKEERGVFYLDIQNLEFLDQAEWKCVAMNDFGHSVTSCFLKLIIPRHYKKPRFLENLQAILSDEGAVNLECKVIGVPQPVLKWYKDGEELKPGDIHRIISGQDGTCCLGTYTCEARNCMGIAASSASLLGFDDSMKAKKKKAEEQALQRNLSLSTIHEERTSQMYDTPVGDITLDDKGEISFSFDGKEVSVSLYETPDLTEEEALQIVEMYADQLSENVTEHNVVELPPLRFVKETSTSGNLLMEAIIIDVSPDYFVSPEEDLRTEADIEDISIADENGPAQLSLDIDMGEDYLEKTMALLSDEKADIPKKVTRKKSDSQRSGDDYFSLSRDQSISEDKRDDDTQVLSESDLQSFASARSLGKPKSKSSKPSLEEGQESSDITKTILQKDEVQKRPLEPEPAAVKPKRERRSSRSSRRSSSGSEKSFGKIKEETTRITTEVEVILAKPPVTVSDEEIKTKITNISSSLSKVINDVQIIERDIILKSELMSSAATASRSLEIISSLVTPLYEIHSITDAVQESAAELQVSTLLLNNLPQALKTLQQSLTIVEKCIDVESDNKTLVKKTCVAFIETCGNEMQSLLSEVNSVMNEVYPPTEQKISSEIQSLTIDMNAIIKFSADTIKARNLLSEASEIKSEEISIETKHLRDTQKAIFELKSPLTSLLCIVESADTGNLADLVKVRSSDVILNDMSASIQDLQTALEQMETLSVKESTTHLHKYNTEIIETVMESVLKLRTSFEHLSTETRKEEDKTVLKQALSAIKDNLNEISSHINVIETKVGTFDILHSDNKLEVLQKMAQILIALENNLPRLETMPEVKTRMDVFHKNLTKVLENVIESNDSKKYFTLMEICDAVKRINAAINNIDTDNVISLASLSNTLRIIQDNLIKNVFESELNCSVLTNITETLIGIEEAINHAEEISIQFESENIPDISSDVYKDTKAQVILEHITHTLAAITTVKSMETCKDLPIAVIPTLENISPLLEELKTCLASIKTNELEQKEHISEISEISYIQALATPLCELNQNIITLNQMVNENVESIKDHSEIIPAIVEPLHELHRTLEILQQDVISQYDENLLPYEISVNMASAVQNLQSCMVIIQEHAGVEIVDEMSTLEDISGIKTTADTIPSDRLVLPLAEEIAIEHSSVPLIEEVPTIATAQALQTLNEYITVLQNPEVIDALDTLSEVSDYSSLKSVAVGLGDLHSGIQEILHPAVIESSDDIINLVDTSKLIAIAEPMQELQQCLSVLDTNNIPVYEHILDMPTEKIHSVIQNISNFKDLLEKCTQILFPALETADKTIEISTRIETLKEVCESLNYVLETAPKIPTKPEVAELKETVIKLMDAMDVRKGIKIDQIKDVTEELYNKVLAVQDEIVDFIPQVPDNTAYEATLMEAVDEIEKNIAVLEQYDFVDLSRASDLTSCMSPQLALEIEPESLSQIAEIVEYTVNILQNVPKETPVADLMIVEDFFKTCKYEFSILKNLMTKQLSHKKAIRLLQEFNVLQDTINNFKEKQMELNLTNDIQNSLSSFLVDTDDCLKSIQTSLVIILENQSELLIDMPLTKIINAESSLIEIVENKELSSLKQLTTMLLNAFNTNKSYLTKIKSYIIEDLQHAASKSSEVETKLLLEKMDELSAFIEDLSNDNSLSETTKEIVAKISTCIQKHQDYKEAFGTGKGLIILKCLSECSDILQEETLGVVQADVIPKQKLQKTSIKTALSELLEPLQVLQNQLINVQQQILSGVKEDEISIDLSSTESLVHTMTEIHKDIIESMEFEEGAIDNEDIAVMMEVDKEIHLIQDSIFSMDSIGTTQIAKEISKPIENLEKSLHNILAKKSEIASPEISKDINSNVDSLENALNRFLNIDLDILVTSAILSQQDAKEIIQKSAELKKVIDADPEECSNIEANSKKYEIVSSLVSYLSRFNYLDIDKYSEGKDPLEIENINNIFLTSYQLLAELEQVDFSSLNKDNTEQEKSAEIMEHIEQYMELTEIVEEVCATIKIDESLKETINMAQELRDNIKLSEESLIKEEDSVILHEMRIEQARLAHKLQDALQAVQVQIFDSVQEQPSDAIADKLQQIAKITSQLQADLVAVTGLEVAIQDLKQIPIESLGESDVPEPVPSELAIHEHPEIIEKEEGIELPTDVKEATTKEVIQKAEIAQVPVEVVDENIFTGDLLQHIEEFISEDIQEILGDLSVKETFNIAEELRKSIEAAEVFLIKEVEDKDLSEIRSEQVTLAHKLHDALSALQVQIFENVQELPSDIPTDALQRILTATSQLEADLIAVTEVQVSEQRPPDNLIESLITVTAEVIPSSDMAQPEDFAMMEEVQLQESVASQDFAVDVSSEIDILAQREGLPIETTAVEGAVPEKDLQTAKSTQISVEAADAKVAEDTLKRRDETAFTDNLLQHIDEFVSEEVVQILDNISVRLSSEELKESLVKSKEMHESLSISEAPISSASGEVVPSGINAEQIQIVQNLQQALIVVQEQIFNNYQDLQTNIDIDNLQRITDLTIHLQEDLATIMSSASVQEHIVEQAQAEVSEVIPKEVDHTEDLKVLQQEVVTVQKIDEQSQDIEAIQETKDDSAIKTEEAVPPAKHDLATLIKTEVYQESVEENSIEQLETLLNELNDKINASFVEKSVDNKEILRDSLDEIQTVIIKLKRDYDGAANDTLNETLEDLECNVRSVQLQINEDSPPELLIEACATLELLVHNIKESEHISETIPEEVKRKNILETCSAENDETVKLLDRASKIDTKDSSELNDIVASLCHIKDTMKVLRESFLADANLLIENGIEIIQHLDSIEDKIFSLEKSVDSQRSLTPVDKDSVVTAVHSVYGSLSNMRSAVCSIQKQFLCENYGKPSENILRAIKNVIVISKGETDNSSWKKFSKMLRKMLNHFEDIKFYINLDKTARIPSDAAFTKIILDELKSHLLEVVSPIDDSESNISRKVNDTVICIDKHLSLIESKSSLEVKEKIPIFKELASELLKTIDLIKFNTEHKEAQKSGVLELQLIEKEDEVIKDDQVVEQVYPSTSKDILMEMEKLSPSLNLEESELHIVKEITSEITTQLEELQEIASLEVSGDKSEILLQSVVQEGLKKADVTVFAEGDVKVAPQAETEGGKAETARLEDKQLDILEPGKDILEEQLPEQVKAEETVVSEESQRKGKGGEKQKGDAESIQKEETKEKKKEDAELKQVAEAQMKLKEEAEIKHTESAMEEAAKELQEEFEVKQQEESEVKMERKEAKIEQKDEIEIKEAEIKVKKEAEIEQKVEAEMEQKVEAEMEQKVKSEMEQKKEAKIEQRVETEMDQKKEAELEPKKQAEMEQKVEAEKEQKVEPEMEQKVEAEIDQKKEAKVEQKVEGEVDQKKEAKVEQKVEAEIDQKKEAKVEQKVEGEKEQKVEPEMEQKVEAEIDQKKEAKVEQKVEGEVDQKKEAKVEQKVEAEIDQKKEAKVEQKVEGEKDQKKEAKVEQKVEAEIEQKKEAKVEQKVKSEMEQKKEAMVEQKVEAEIDQKKEAKVEQKVEAEIEQKKEAKVEQKVEAEIEQKKEAKVEQKVEDEKDQKEEAKVEQKVEAEIEQKKEAKVEQKVEDEKDQKEEAKVEQKVEAEIEQKKEAKVEQKVEGEKDQKKEAKVEQKVEAEIEQKKEAKVEQKVEAEIEQKKEAKVEQKVEAEIEQKKEAKVEQKVEGEIDQKKEAMVEQKVEAEIDQKKEAKVEQKVEAEIEQKKEPKVEQKVEGEKDQKKEAKVEQKVEAEIEQKKEAKVEQKVEAEIEQKKEAKVEQKVEGEIDQKKEAKVEQKVEGEKDQKKEAKVEQKVEAEIEQKKEAKVEQKVEAEIDQKKEAKVEQKVEAEIDQKKEVKVEQKVEAEIEQKEDTEIEPKKEAEIEQKVEAAIEQKKEAVIEQKVETEMEQKKQVEIVRKEKDEVELKEKHKEEADAELDEGAVRKSMEEKQKEKDVEMKYRTEADIKQKEGAEEKEKVAAEIKDEKEAELDQKDAKGKQKQEKEKEEVERKVMEDVDRNQKQEDDERKLKEDTIIKQKEEAERKLKDEAEIKQSDEEKKIKGDEENKRKEKAEMRQKEEIELKQKEAAEVKQKEEIKLKQTEEAEIKQKEETEMKLKEEKELEQKEVELKQKEGEEEKRKGEPEIQLKEEAEIKAIEETEHKQREEDEQKQKKEQEKKQLKAEKTQKEVAERKQKEDEKRIQKERAGKEPKKETEIQLQEEDERKQQEDEEKKRKERDEKKQKQEAERKVKDEAEIKQKEEAKRKQEKEAEIKQKQEAERKLKEEAEKKQMEEAERKLKEEAEIKQKEDDKKRKEEDERQQKEEAERKQEKEAEIKQKQEAERKLKEEAEKKQMEEAERKLKEEAEIKQKEGDKKRQEEDERQQKEEAERKQKEDDEKKRKEKADQKEKEEAERKLKEETDKKQKEEAERKLKEEADKKQKEEAERKQKEDETKRKEEDETQQKEEAERKQKKATEIKQKEDEKKLKEENERQQKEEAERKQKEATEIKQKEDEKKRKEEDERQQKEEAERKLKEATEIKQKEDEKKRKEEDERQQKEEDERQQKEEAERKQKEDDEKKRKEKAEKKEKEEAERKSREEAEKKEKEEAERKSGEEAEKKQKEEAERKSREEAEKKQKEEAERKSREEAEKKQKEEAERKSREEAEKKQKEEAERKSREEAEKQQKEEAERKSREEAEKKQKEEAERKSREEAEKKQKEEAERKSRDEAEKKQKEEAERKSRDEAEKKQKEEAERKSKDEAEKKQKEEAERKSREEAEKKQKEEAERKSREEAEKKQKEEAERKSREKAEKQQKEEAERKSREEAEKKQKEEAERKSREEAEKKQKEEAERKSREEAEKKQKEEAERKSREKAEKKQKEEAERKSREETEKKQKEEAERKSKDEAEKKQKEEAERKSREEAEKKQKEEAERKLKEEERKRREEDERQQKEEAGRKQKEDEEKKRKKEDDRKQKKETERKQKEEAEIKLKEEAEIKQKEDEKKRKEEYERKQKEETERKQKEEAEKKQKEETERKQKEVEEKKRKEKAEKKQKEEVERKQTEESERKHKHDTKKKRQEETELKEKEQIGKKIKPQPEKAYKEEVEKIPTSITEKQILIQEQRKTDSKVFELDANKESKEFSRKRVAENGTKEREGQPVQEAKVKMGKDYTDVYSEPIDKEHYIKEYQYGPERKTYESKDKIGFIDRNHKDYTMEFIRPSGYRERTFDSELPTKERDGLGKSTSIFKAQTLTREAQLRSSASPYRDIGRSGEIADRRSDMKHRTKALSEVRTLLSEKRTSLSRDSKRRPVFSTYLTDRTAVEGSRVKLTCSVLSSTDPTITWYKNGVLLNNKLKYKTKYVDGLITMEVLNAVPTDSAEYSCTVENENGSVNTSATLKVYPSFEASPIPPTFTRSIREMYHLAENELVLECRIRGQPLPTITWMKDDRPIVSNEKYQAYYLADGVCRLAICTPTPEDSGKYTCKAENSIWCDQITHQVNFTGKETQLGPNIATIEKSRFNRQAMESRRPHFTNVLTDYKVSKGGTIGLQVEIKGAPTRVEWLREGRSVTETYTNARTFVEQGLYTLALSDVTEKESGMYTCRAWSTQGNVDMHAVITVVPPEYEGKPAIIVGRPEKDVLISVGEDLNISFRVQGEPKPKVIFMKGIRDITSSQRVCKMTSDDYIKFTVKRSVISDAGTYCILARNAYGCDRAFVTVVIRQRASSENLISDWTYPVDDSAISIADRRYKSVPERIPGEPSVVDGGNNWVSLAWPKPDSRETAPVLAYKIESWLLGKEGGARWVELGITPLNSFDAFNLKQGEEYHFRVTPRNRYGWGESVQTSTPVGVGLAGDRPEFVDILPGQLKILVGETAELTCSVKGKPVPEVVWMKNGHEIEEDDRRMTTTFNGYNCSLTINDIVYEDEARYSCEATNVHGRASTYARLAVVTDRSIFEADAKLKRERSADVDGEYPPQFTMRLRDRRVQATYPVRLTCQVVGGPPPTVTWFKDGVEIITDNRRTKSQDEHFHTLEIAPTNLDDGGIYEVMARNPSGAISCRCSLVVDKGIRAYVAPEFCCGLEPLYRLNEGEELRISAVVEAYPSVGVTWYRDGVRLRSSRRAIMTLDRDGQIELALASITTRDAGVYTCTASNEVGRASTSGKVEVIEGEQTQEKKKTPPMVISPDIPYSKEPMFIRKPRSSEAWEGDTVIIQCEVVGDPKPEVYWLRDFLKPDYYRDATHFKRVGQGPEYRFEIPHAKLDYTGAYSVVAKNIHGEAKAIISLQILAKDPTSSDDAHNIRYGRVEVIPRFDRDLTDLLSYDGDAIEFECHVSGNPDPDIRWFHYSELVRECPDFEWSNEDGTARLKIKQVTADDEGTYTCEAVNSLGKATSSACLVVYPPGEPNTLSQRLRRPPALLSAASTPRSTPRTTPARSLSRTPGPDTRRLCSPSRQIAPKFYTYPFNKVVDEGDSVRFQCAVKGLPAPWATWDKDGVIITPSSRITIKEKDEMLRILEIDEVTIEDVGLYRITVENDYGRAEASARLEVISHKGKFYAGVRSYSASPRKSLPYRKRFPSSSRQD